LTSGEWQLHDPTNRAPGSEARPGTGGLVLAAPSLVLVSLFGPGSPTAKLPVKPPIGFAR